jgi:hypothetical protein
VGVTIFGAVGGPDVVVVPIAIRDSPKNHSAAEAIVYVRVGDSRRIPVLLDTGSTGLSVLAGAVGTTGSAAFSASDRVVSQVYEDGVETQQTLASAPIQIGSLRSARAVQFGIITQTGCVAADPNCPALPPGVDGILGVGLANETVAAANPLLSLPAPFSRSWRISLSNRDGSLTLGAPAPSQPVVVMPLHPTPNVLFGQPVEPDEPVVCWSFATAGAACRPHLTPAHPSCTSTRLRSSHQLRTS